MKHLHIVCNLCHLFCIFNFSESHATITVELGTNLVPAN